MLTFCKEGGTQLLEGLDFDHFSINNSKFSRYQTHTCVHNYAYVVVVVHGCKFISVGQSEAIQNDCTSNGCKTLFGVHERCYRVHINDNHLWLSPLDHLAIVHTHQMDDPCGNFGC